MRQGFERSALAGPVDILPGKARVGAPDLHQPRAGSEALLDDLADNAGDFLAAATANTLSPDPALL